MAQMLLANRDAASFVAAVASKAPEPSMIDAADFISALGRRRLTWAYDIAIALMTRESTCRGLLLSALEPRPEDVILDVGCGTGTLAIMIKRQCPQARMIGLDPDPAVPRIAHRKAIQAGVTIELIEGRADRILDVVPAGAPNKVVSSLVFHHLPLATKRAAFEAIYAVLRRGGGLCVADCGLQRTWLMRWLLHASGVTTIETAAQAAAALRPIAGPLAFIAFAAGIVGTGLLAVPVLAGSSAYAIAESINRPVGLGRKPREALTFYSIIAAATLIGVAIHFSPIDPIKALYWSAVLNGILSVPIMAVTMVIAVQSCIMGRFVLPAYLRWGGWISTALIASSVVAVLATMIT